MPVGRLAAGLYGAPADGLQSKLWGMGRKISSEGFSVDKSQAKRFCYLDFGRRLGCFDFWREQFRLFSGQGTFDRGGPMFAPAIVGAGMRLSAKAFEAGRSALSNSARRMAEGCRSALLSMKPEKIAQWRPDANGKMRLSPAPAAPLPLVSSSSDEETSCCRGRQGLRREVTRSSRDRAWQGASLRPSGRATSGHVCAYRPFERRRSSAPSRKQNQRMNHQGRILTWLSRVRVSDPIGSSYRSN
jgi:hypothetical protein